MISICPKCHHEIEHEDYLFEVVCSCGARFNPFMTSQDSAPKAEPGPQPPAEKVPAFSESEAAFSAIRNYGEALSYNLKPEVQPEKKESIQADSVRPKAGTGICSVLATLGSSDDPLGPGLALLITQSKQQGAGGVADVRWQVMPDGLKVLLSGTLLFK